jgi:hypothetical protein
LELIDYLVDRTDRLSACSPGRVQAIVIGKISPYGLLVKNCKKAIACLTSGSGYLVITVDVGGPGRLKKLAGLLTLRWRLATLRRALGDSGADFVDLFGVAHCPLLLFPLEGPAGLYAKNNLLVTGHGLRRAFYNLVTWTAGCHVCAGSVLVVGRKP